MKIAIVLSLLSCILAPGISSWAQDTDFRIVINKDNEIGSMNKKRISKIFLKRITKWDNGSSIAPIDLDSKSPVREAFSRDIHERSASSIKNYWQREIFSGRGTPPPELDSDAKVIQFVSSHPGAIGYVSTSANIAHVKVLRISD